MIPKCDKPLSVGDFRPISLCNVNYKIITKTIANKLKGILEEIISNSEFSFLLGRVIIDNVVIGHECLHFIKGKARGKDGWVVMKLDLGKAF